MGRDVAALWILQAIDKQSSGSKGRDVSGTVASILRKGQELFDNVQADIGTMDKLLVALPRT